MGENGHMSDEAGGTQDGGTQDGGTDTAAGITALGHDVFEIDTRMAGYRGITAGYLIRSDRPCLVETGTAPSAPVVRDALASLGVGPQDLATVVVTHIHLDHAGGVGDIAKMFPAAPTSAASCTGSTGPPSPPSPAEVGSFGQRSGSPKLRSALLSGKPVAALIWLPARVSTSMPLARATGTSGSRT